MPEPNTRMDVGRWASASYRVRQPGPPDPQPERRKRSFFSKFCRCCKCCAGPRDDTDWGPAPGEVPGSRPAQPVVREGMLVVSGVDLMGQRSGATRRAHHTDEFEYDELIVRRGQPFDIRLQLQQPYDPELHRVCLELLVAAPPPTAPTPHCSPYDPELHRVCLELLVGERRPPMLPPLLPSAPYCSHPPLLPPPTAPPTTPSCTASAWSCSSVRDAPPCSPRCSPAPPTAPTPHCSPYDPELHRVCLELLV
ncbi:unnamed protein product, partial [Eretmochelys imbricata]